MKSRIDALIEQLDADFEKYWEGHLLPLFVEAGAMPNPVVKAVAKAAFSKGYECGSEDAGVNLLAILDELRKRRGA